MDKKDPSSWKHRFLSIFGASSKHLNSTQQQRSDTVGPPVSTSIESAVEKSVNSQEQRESTVSQRLHVPQASVPNSASNAAPNNYPKPVPRRSKTGQLNDSFTVETLYGMPRSVIDGGDRMSRQNSDKEKARPNVNQKFCNSVSEGVASGGKLEASRNYSQSNLNLDKETTQNDSRNQHNATMLAPKSSQTSGPSSNVNRGLTNQNLHQAIMFRGLQQSRSEKLQQEEAALRKLHDLEARIRNSDSNAAPNNYPKPVQRPSATGQLNDLFIIETLYGMPRSVSDRMSRQSADDSYQNKAKAGPNVNQTFRNYVSEGKPEVSRSQQSNLNLDKEITQQPHRSPTPTSQYPASDVFQQPHRSRAQNDVSRNQQNATMAAPKSSQPSGSSNNGNRGRTNKNPHQATKSRGSQKSHTDRAGNTGQTNRHQQHASVRQTSHQSDSNVETGNLYQPKRPQTRGTTKQASHGSGTDKRDHNKPNKPHQARSAGAGPNPGSGTNQRREGNQRTYFGFKKFENYLKSPADSVVISLHLEMEAFESFLKEPRAYEGGTFGMLLEVLSEKVFSDECNLVNYQNDIVRLIAYPEIMNRFRDKCLTVDDSKFKFIFNVADFLKRRMPVSAADSLMGLVTLCVSRLLMIKDNPKYGTLLEQFQELFKSLHEKRQQEEAEVIARKPLSRGKFTDYDLKSFDKLKPPDDFRNIPIIPTMEELLSSEPSFLRPNKQAGSYADADHYLDVQFRLLREDFLQPLKQGIQEYLSLRKTTNNPRMPKGSPIRVYYKVKCLTAEVKFENLNYWIELPTDYSKINWDKSKRLLPGNLVLLTKNSASLDSVVFATVGFRNDDDLKKHRKLTIIPEKAQSRIADVLCDETDLLLIESEVYWESFRHVLKTAQNLNLSTFPLAKYIVSACNNVEPPPSLVEQRFDDGDVATTIRLCFQQRYFAVHPFVSRTWPLDATIGLDANQFDAFKAALTKQFVIIQGPPGTGKTYVGLRIAEVILQNPQLRTGRKEHDVDDLAVQSEYRGPLLCICYTNHALDQFLEGILNIMNRHEMDPKIVRVGGRSKSEVLREFNLRDMARRTNRQLGGLQRRELNDLERDMKQNERSIRNLKQIAAELQWPTGIIKFESIDDQIYQTLCSEFSSQLLDKLSSPSFFKLSNSDVYNITEGSAIDAVKKWFEYLQVNANKNAKGRKAQKDNSQAETPSEEAYADVGEEEFYDMDELMEHRMIFDDVVDHAEIEAQFEHSNSVGRYHGKEMSIPHSTFLLKEYERNIQRNVIHDKDSMAVANTKRRNVAQVRESVFVEQKRLDVLVEIFACLNENRVKIPDVAAKLETLRRFNTTDSINVVDKTLPLVAQRYAAYLIVAKRAKHLMNETVRGLEEKLIESAETIAQLKRQHEVEILKNADVVGMTTTGAAKFHDLLAKMKCRIVIVEEAAEVLEAHIVTSLTKYTDHLILIGDHQQLKPSTAVYELSKKYDLDVSLFERMINNHMTCYSLLAQHRMRPDIADLIRGSIYANLDDARNVHQYECIKGMSNSLFFLTHEKLEESEGDSMSKLNEFEADYLAGLAGYLLKQGYLPSSITVLTTYTGQLFLLKSKFRTSESLKSIHITCVDNFQGEENEIILLSLVRSNLDGKMGFLSISNRVCVALSRAKKGLYVIGNMKMLSKQTIWSQINAKLEQKKQIGPKMTVVCQRHQTHSDIAKGEDFIKKCPEGGCSKVCGLLMKCHHLCPRFCHAQDLQHENYRCRELCRKFCPSGHPCMLVCHFGTDCLPCRVKVDKPRSCGHNISVDCHRSAEDEFCRTQIKRLLKCDHEVIVFCSQKMDDWLCRKIVDKVLTCGHESKLMCHVDPDTYRCNIEVRKELPCTHYRNMKCFEQPAVSMCKTLVDRELPCGHNQKMECRLDPKEATCAVKVTATLDCEHTVVVPCFRKTNGKIDCVELCEERLSCGHSCPQKCHYYKDRHHDKFQCKKPCSKSCANGHPCKTNHTCSSQCKKCRTIVERAHPICGHIGKIPCCDSSTEFQCQEQCTKVLPCGHSCGKKCCEPCGPCRVPTSKSTPICGPGHKQTVPCNESPTIENCKEKVQILSTLCGHEITVACNMRSASSVEIQSHCTKPCGFTFPGENGCGHKCSGTCSSCCMGTLHQKCLDKCLRPLICGHLCDFPCSRNCPPCKKRCQMKCEHSKCKKMCGDACFICKERCSWQCKHVRCKNLCGEMCDRGPCNEPCDKKLRCGHACIGFCGEMCPPLCRICDLAELTEFQLLFTEDEEDARFIWLPDCKHAIEVEGLTMHFNATDETGEIGLKKCPRCTTVIRTLSGRFGNIIRKTFRDVAQVKKNFFGNRHQNQKLTEEIHQNLQLEATSLVNFLPSVKALFEMIIYFDDKSATAKLRQVDINTLNSLKQIWVWVKEVLKNVSDYSSVVIKSDCDSLFANITNRPLPLCSFEVDNIGSEIQRLVHKIQFNRRWETASHTTRERSNAKDLHAKISAILRSKGIYDEKCQRKFIDYIKDLEKLLKTGIGISEGERLQIIKALDMKQGHWFKCPNGHPYIITECGGAMQVAKCYECGANIGGGNHALLATNQFAPEMDGAARPAWDSVMVPQNFGL
ncbi:NFX1-type zinc finger-containing protein 1-like isoform X2 [Bradysia coprophila]|uniref:NFX1-type zinc finger-containing protein 1-like isoform X2 n=1 Tax=Bradysia coprophila TaxID=38358 RepID=UPI00187D860B|nr:NFX1-type zinc finger-containing protein 1-like isoform X2 [Bradysia coprophila]